MLTKYRIIIYDKLTATLRKAMRNGNWRKLKFIERLKETKGMRIFKFKRGFEKAVEMLEKGEEKGVFVWAPSVKEWLKDPFVKNISSDRAKPMGYYTNILAKMPILQKFRWRLIIKELERMDFDDAYSMTGSEQEKVFSSVVQKYSKVSETIR